MAAPDRVGVGQLMSDSLFSPLWYRVADRHPHLRSDVQVQRQYVRDELWYVLVNTADAQQYRINQRAYQLIGRCDGRRSLQDIWDALLEELRDDAPTQDEVIRILGQVEEQGLLFYDVAPDAESLQRRLDGRNRRGFINPFAMRIPLGDPTTLLRRLEWLCPLLFNPVAFWLWLATVMAAVSVAASNWIALHAHAVAWMPTPRYLGLAFAAFPVIKALHELGHALAVRRWGGGVHEAGFSLFVLVPAPYVNASAASAFRSRFKRVIVSAAGIMVELALASAALAIWLNVQPGLVSDLAFVTMFIAGVSTLLFNGNPLLTFDGYYVLCDALDLPNLGPRSREWWAGVLRRLIGRENATGLRPARGERKWLLLYAPMSLAYRFFVSGLMIFWIGGHSLVLGSLAASVVAFTLIVKPGWSAVARLAGLPAGQVRRRAVGIAAAVIAVVLLALCALPLPYQTVASAVVWPPEQARVRPGTDGFVAQVIVREGERVAAGDLLLKLEDPVLFAERARILSQIERLQSNGYAALLDDPVQSQNAAQELTRVNGDLQRIEQRIASLDVRAQTGGTLVMPRQQDLPGTLVRQGDTIGYVLAGGSIGVRAAVPEYDAALVHDNTRSAEVFLAEGKATAVHAELVRDLPAATHTLPSAALGDRGGGPYVTDPADREGLRSLDPIVIVDLTLPSTEVQRLGGRAWVRFEHDAEPVANRWWRRMRQLLLQHVNPAA